MASRVYSETFIRTAGVGTHTFTVPYGKRAIIKRLEVVSFVAAGGAVYLTIAGVYLFYWTTTAAVATRSVETMAVAYGGQNMVLTIGVAGIHTTVSGYILDDPVAAEAEPASFDAPF